jgi:hypothetical protein
VAERTPRRSRPVPSVGLIGGVVVAVVGYLLPWFADGPSGWFSGILYLRQGWDAGWTLWPLVFFAVALVAAVWAGGSDAAAVISLTASVVAGVYAVCVIAASLVATGVDSFIAVMDLQFTVGMPILAAGLGIAIAAGCHTLAASVVAELEDRIRRRTTS